MLRLLYNIIKEFRGDYVSEIKIKHANELNRVPMRGFTSTEMDLFFSLCAKMKDKGTQKIRFDFETLRELSNYKPTATKRFANDLENVYDKMLQLTYGTYEDGIREKFVLFTGFKIDENEQFVEISVNPELEHILNELSSEFVKYELVEFTNIRSSYAKTMYRLLKQYRSTGFFKVKVEDFKELLDVPKSYQMSDIDRRILKPTKNELSAFFNPLEIKKVKAKKGNRIAILEFRFKEIAKEKTPVPMLNWLENE